MITIEELRKMTISEIVTKWEELSGQRLSIDIQLRLNSMARQHKLTDKYLGSIAEKMNEMMAT